jgi:hypothetical protein
MTQLVAAGRDAALDLGKGGGQFLDALLPCSKFVGCGYELRHGLEQWIRFHNHERGHSSLDDRTPDEVYYGLPHPFAEAA